MHLKRRPHTATVDLDDLFEFDPLTLAWTDLTWIEGRPPAMDTFGFAATSDALYVFAGYIDAEGGKHHRAIRTG